MSSPATKPAVRDRIPQPLRSEFVYYVGAILVGAVLIVIAAIRQPFSYDELQQIAPYASSDYSTITGATRQPPLDPLLGALFHHVFGKGQLQDRLVPVLSGIGALVVMGLLLRRLGLRYAGAVALLIMATSPLMVRYSAYTRPYALSIFLMLLAAWALTSWLADCRRRWLVTFAVAAFLLPLVRVPEPTIFLLGTAAVLAWLGWRRRLRWAHALPPTLVTLAAVAFLGLTQFLSLAHSAHGFFDPSPSGVVQRFPDGVHELVTAFLPLLGHSFPRWPITLLLLVVTPVIAAARRRLTGWTVWWPLIAAPIGFALAYHFVNPFSFDALPYRARAASFFVPPFILVVASMAAVVEQREVGARLRAGLAALLAGVLLGQVSDTADVLVYNAAPDFAEISAVLTDRLPDDAIVLYDRPTPAGASRQPFLGTMRYMGAKPVVRTVVTIPTHADELPDHGPVYLLFNGQCAYSGRCVPGLRHAVDVDIPGWEIVYRQDRFTLYAPTHGQAGRAGVARALESSGKALGPELGYLQTYAAAAVLKEQGRSPQGRALIDGLQSDLSDELKALIHHEDQSYDIDPFAPRPVD